MKTVQTLIRPNILKLSGYSSARSLVTQEAPDTLYFDANEVPWTSVEVPMDTIHTDTLNRYPDPQPEALLKRLAEIYNISPAQLLVGRGSDDGIDVLIRAFCEPKKDSILVTPPTYGVYRFFAEIQDIDVQEAPLTLDFDIDLGAIQKTFNENTKIIFLCSPNNPTGNNLSTDSIADLLEFINKRAIVVVDEAYFDFSASSSFIPWITDYPNLIVLRTLSKAYGLAGLRIGSLVGHPELISILQKVRAPYPLSAPAIELAVKALEPARVEQNKRRCKELLDERTRVENTIRSMTFVERIFPSDSNFILIKLRDKVSEFVAFCKSQGVILRDRSTEVNLAGCVRLSIGTAEQNHALLRCFSQWESWGKA